MLQNHYAFSPNPWFIAAFFSGQAVLQLYWIRKLFLLDPPEYQRLSTSPAAGVSAPTIEAGNKLEEEEAVRTAVEYAPIFALGNLCIGQCFMLNLELAYVNHFPSSSWMAILLDERIIHSIPSFGHDQHCCSAICCFSTSSSDHFKPSTTSYNPFRC